MKRKILTITYTCPEDKVNLGEADIMGTILQKLGELGAYDINLKASSAEVREPASPKVRRRDPKSLHSYRNAGAGHPGGKCSACQEEGKPMGTGYRYTIKTLWG